MKLTWLGHSAFHMTFNGKSVLIDPFLTGNPQYPEGYVDGLQTVDLIALTHGHGDHFGDTVELAKRFNCPVAAQYEIAMYLAQSNGVENVEPLNIGGGCDTAGIRVSMVQALHSSALILDGKPMTMGDAAGLIFEASGEKTVYHAGDTGVFSDMALIQRIYQPKVGLIPVGDRVTMGPREATIACNEFLDLETIIPIHYQSFDFIPGDPYEFQRGVKRGSVTVASPGQSLSL